MCHSERLVKNLPSPWKILRRGLLRMTIIVSFLTFNFVLFTLPVFAQVPDIGQSRIHPASPLYFLKSVREILELKFAGTTRVRAYRQLEFSTRRIREVKSLVSAHSQDLIQPTLERYWWHLGELKGVLALKDTDMVGQAAETVRAHMQALQTIYGQISERGAKRSVRTAVYRLSQWDQWLIEQLGSVKEISFIPELASSKLSGCNFLSREASSSVLNEVERAVFAERAQNCLEPGKP